MIRLTFTDEGIQFQTDGNAQELGAEMIEIADIIHDTMVFEFLQAIMSFAEDQRNDVPFEIAHLKFSKYFYDFIAVSNVVTEIEGEVDESNA